MKNWWNKYKIEGSNVVAESLYGKQILGEKLSIDATDSKGFKYCTIDSQGFQLKGMDFYLSGELTDAEKAAGKKSNNISITPEDGLTLITNNKLAKISLNPYNGIECDTSTDGINYSRKFYYDMDTGSSDYNNLIVDGIIKCKNLLLLRNGAYVSVLTDQYTSEGTKISGSYLQGRGLKVYDNSNNVTMSVSPVDGSVYIKGNIDMGAGSHIDWGNVNKPTKNDLGQWTTYIDDSGIYTSTIITNQLRAGSVLIDNALIGSLNVDKLIGNRIVGKTLQTSSDTGNTVTVENQYISCWNNSLEKVRIGFSTSSWDGVARPYAKFGDTDSNCGVIFKSTNEFSLMYITNPYISLGAGLSIMQAGNVNLTGSELILTASTNDLTLSAGGKIDMKSQTIDVTNAQWIGMDNIYAKFS